MLIRMFDIHETVIDVNQRRHGISDERIANAIQLILNSYSNEGLKAAPNAIDFNLIEIRCAYLYLYCTSHSHLVYSSLACFRMESERELFQWLWDRQGHPKQFLSIGGGPGSDLIGLLLCLQPFISNDAVGCYITDAYDGWSDVLKDTLETLQMHHHYRDLNVAYKKVDLLRPIAKDMHTLLRNADFVTMSKFVSAISADMAAARRLRSMLQVLRPGTLVYFVDNAGGEAFRLGERVASSCGLIPIWGPVYHFEFRVPKNMEPMKEVLSCPRFGGVRPQTSSKVSIVVWKKVDAPPRGLKRTMSVGNRPLWNANSIPPACRTKIVAVRRNKPVAVPVPNHRPRTYSLRHTPARAQHRRVASVPAVPASSNDPTSTNIKRVLLPCPNRGALTPYSLRQLREIEDVQVPLADVTKPPPILGLLVDIRDELGLSEKRNHLGDSGKENWSTPYRLRDRTPKSQMPSPAADFIPKKMRF